jgi:hypothetical protein
MYFVAVQCKHLTLKCISVYIFSKHNIHKNRNLKRILKKTEKQYDTFDDIFQMMTKNETN